MNIEIIYEDKNVLAINKPSGLLVHPARDEEKRETVVDWILANRPEIQGVGEEMKLSSGKIMERPGIVHRLDKETSGILLIAKNQEAFLFLKKQFQEHAIKKTYLALVYGSLKENEGMIDKPIGRSHSDWRQKSVSPKAVGVKREAVTEYKVRAKNKEFSFVEVYPKTGRTHQIRVHLKAIGHPVACDPLYASKQECPVGLERLGLHALRVEFTNQEGKVLRLEAPLPEDLRMIVKEIFPDLQSTF